MLMSHGTTVLSMKKIELNKIQNEAARIAVGATKLVSLNSLHNEISWESLEKRRLDHKLTLFYKMLNNLKPQYLSSLVPQPVRNLSRYNLRNSNDLQTIAARTNQYYYSFLPSSIRALNSLPGEAKETDSVNSFKSYLKKNKDCYTGTRKAQILHTRLRTNYNSLNLDLFLKNISDSPLCSCGNNENTQHFFFLCKHYQAQRNALMNAISAYQTPLLNLLLYGDISLPQETNTNIFKHVQKFILETKRF